MMLKSKIHNFRNILYRLIITWMVCYGCITALAVLGLWINHMILPLLGFLLLLPIVFLGNYNLNRDYPNCSLITHYSFYSIFWSSVVMVIINLISANIIHVNILDTSKSHIPFISSMVVYPVTAVMFAISIWRRWKTEYCNACYEQSGHMLSKSLERNVLHSESHVLRRLFLGLSAFLTLVVYGYYFTMYINVNFNSPDIFFFFVIPIAMYVLSVIFVLMRFSNLEFQVSVSSKNMEKESRTMVRYMVIRKDKVMLEFMSDDNEIMSDDNGIGLWDTPAVTDVPYTDELSDEEANELFHSISGVDNFSLKRLFATSAKNTNTFHFAAFIEPDDAPTPGFAGQWFSLYDVDLMMKTGKVARPFAYAMHRVFTITMAWKTYDRKGNRLYPIKNYRPTFRLSDFKDWDVDYTDLHWLSVSKNNEDQPFFKFRRFWRRHVSGVDTRWRKRNS